MTATTEPGFNQAPSIAQHLSFFYTGLESCLEKKFKLSGIGAPDKTDKYHQAILAQAIESKILPPSCAPELKDLLGFRHIARHGYGLRFRLEEVKYKAATAGKVWKEITDYWEAQKAGANPNAWMKDVAALNQPADPGLRSSTVPEEIPKTPSPGQIAQSQQAIRDQQKRPSGDGKQD
jgi:hypothetical protein